MTLDLLIFLAGALLIALAVRWWRGDPPVAWIVAYGLLVLGFFAVPLATSKVQVPVDVVYRTLPWAETVAQPVTVQNPLLSDVPLQMLPFRTLVRRRLLALEPPLWAHELGTGQPLLGNAQSAPFAPLHLMALPLPPLRGLTVAAAWQVFLGLLLMHALTLALARRDGGDELSAGSSSLPWPRQAGAALAAVAFAFSAASMTWLYYPLGMTFMWLPGLVLGIVALARGARRALPGLVAVAAGMAVSGHPETVGHGAVLAVGLGLVLLVRGPRVGRRSFLIRSASAALLAGCLAAPVLLPVLQVTPESERKAALDFGNGPARPRIAGLDGLVALVEPLAWGSPRDHDYRAPPGGANFHELCSGYAGALTLALALAGALVVGGRVLAIVLAGGGALLVGFGVSPAFELFAALPGMGFAINSRLRLFWALAAALAAGLAAPELARRRAGRWVTAGTLAVVLGLVAGVRPPFDSLHQRIWWLLALAGPAAALASLAVPRWRRGFVAVSLAAVAADLLTLGARYQPLVPPGRQLEPPPVVTRLVERAGESPQTGGGPGPADRASPVRVSGEAWSLTPNLGAIYGLWDPRGFDPMRPFRPLWLLRQRLSFGRPGPGGSVVTLAPFDLPMLRMLDVRYLLTSHGRRLDPPWRRAFDDVGGRVWELPGTLDLFYVPRRARSVTDPDRALAITLRNRDFSALAVYDAPGARAGAQRGRVWVRSVGANGFELTSSSAAGAVIASSVSWEPGWRLRIDGEPAPTPFRVNWAFVGLRAPPGVHRLELDYRPAGWRWGLVAFWGALAAGLGWSAWSSWSPKRRRADERPTRERS